MKKSDICITFDPEDYDYPPQFERTFQVRSTKKSVTIAFAQVQYFGSLGVPWSEMERFFGVSKTNLIFHFADAYERGRMDTNVKLRNKMVELALDGSIPALIFLAKNRLNMSDNGPTNIEDHHADKTNLNVTLKVLKNERTENTTETHSVS